MFTIYICYVNTIDETIFEGIESKEIKNVHEE